MEKTFRSFFKTVDGNEGDKCHYPTRLDTYGCGCQHDCSYCYAKSPLDFRGLWNPKQPRPADIKAIRRKVASLPDNLPPIRLGGMTDCFMPYELEARVTYETIRALNRRGQPYLIVTKSANVARPEYLDILRPDLAHVQVTVTTTDDRLGLTYEHASPASERIKAIEALCSAGIDTALRLSPYIPQYVDTSRLAEVRCDKMVVEFLRVNPFIKRWFDLDFSEYTLTAGGYKHLPLERKVEYIKALEKTGKTITVCEDESEAYEYWKNHYNPNPQDCCNLRL